MVKDLDYSTISHVMESWEEIRRVPDYENVAGKILFKKFFEDCPQVKILFGFPIDIDASSSELLESKRFLMHASYMIQMLDTALNMLGPDTELITEIMLDLGSKHVRYGVKAEMFLPMRDALLVTLKTLLGDKFTGQLKEAWIVTYDSLSQDMIRAQLKK